MTTTLRMTMQAGTIGEIALTDEQATNATQGRGVAYTVRDEGVVLDDDGPTIRRQSAIPQQLDEAA
ncbi:MAG: hypothetical protein ACLGI5_14555 [Thermoleophilia bacterium]